MSKERVLVLVLMLSSVATQVAAQETVYIPPMGNSEPLKTEYLSAECTPDASGQRMTCEFIQVSFTHEAEDWAAAELQKYMGHVSSEDLAEIAQACDSRDRDDFDQQMRKEADQGPPLLRSYARRYTDSSDAFCRTPTLETYTEIIRGAVDAQQQTCTISVRRSQSSFTKQTPQRWVSHDGPIGYCGYVTVETLEQEPTDSRWTFHSSMSPTNEDAACRIVKATLDFSSRQRTKDLPCRLIEPGGFEVK
jgi:hypothetical protein